ncbi:hypothetical protein U1Q18_026641 [Sarracenia purpurea var. burkii]
MAWPIEYRETSQEPEQTAEAAPQEIDKEDEIEDKEPMVDTHKESELKEEEEEEVPPLLTSTEEIGDLLGLNEINPKAAELEESNAMALAIVPPGKFHNVSLSRKFWSMSDPMSCHDPLSTSQALTEIGKTSGWELALVTTPSNNGSHLVENKLAGGFDKLLLDSLYEDDAARRQIQLQNAGYSTGYGYEMNAPNPFDSRDPFIMSNSVAPPANVQMAMMAQQQQYQQQQQQYQQQQQQNTMMMMMTPHQYLPQYPQQQMPYASPANPFGDPFNYPQNPHPPQGNHSLL